jgi:1-acyl-sn-glycerol-3-phosphate acyltransferase
MSEAARQLQAQRPTLLWNLGRTICRVYTSREFDLKVYGVHHIPRSGGVLIVSNHQSYLDPVLIGVQICRPMSYLAKSELFEKPAFSWLIRNLNAFPVRQGEGDVGAVKETIRRLAEGHMLTMFPEGTRTPDGTLQPIQPGIGLIVRRAGVPVVPAVIDGSFEAWPRQDLLPHAHPIRVLFGSPMELGKMKTGEIVSEIGVTLRRMFDDLRGGNLKSYTSRS